MWIIQGIVSSGDYLRAIVPDHPNATKNGYVLLHRVIMENQLGRLLTSEEEVHHIDFNPFNNDPSNLQVLSGYEHRMIHNQNRWSVYLLMQCPWCGYLFYKARNNTHWVKREKDYDCCSRQCIGYLSGHIRKHGLTPEIEQRLAWNIQGEFKCNSVTGEFTEL